MKKISIIFSIFIVFFSLSVLFVPHNSEAYFGISLNFGSNNGYGYGYGYGGYDPNNWRAYSNYSYGNYGNYGYMGNYYNSYGTNYGYGNNMDGYFYSDRPMSRSRYNYNQNYSTDICSYRRCY